MYFDQIRAEAVRDGVVVDFAAATQAVRELKSRAESALGVSSWTDGGDGLSARGRRRARAGPAGTCWNRPGWNAGHWSTRSARRRPCSSVADGAIVDVGGGSTGVGVYAGGELIDLGDLPGGGHHLNLILAGALGIERRARPNSSSGEHGVEYLAAAAARHRTDRAQHRPADAGPAGPARSTWSAAR